jgi:hypothetical protein
MLGNAGATWTELLSVGQLAAPIKSRELYDVGPTVKHII